MMNHVSVFRHREGLEKALAEVRELKVQYKDVGISDKGSCFNRELMDYFELGYMLDLAETITLAALWRQESRGAHSREDFPQRNDDQFLVHSMASLAEDAQPRLSTRPVSITRFQPKERTY